MHEMHKMETQIKKIRQEKSTKKNSYSYSGNMTDGRKYRVEIGWRVDSMNGTYMFLSKCPKTKMFKKYQIFVLKLTFFVI